jgi:hypothetical protein
METRLLPIERDALKVQRLLAPAGHDVVGPASGPPYWRCGTCRATWSNGGHPRPRPALPGLAAQERRRAEVRDWANR